MVAAISDASGDAKVSDDRGRPRGTSSPSQQAQPAVGDSGSQAIRIVANVAIAIDIRGQPDVVMQHINNDINQPWLGNSLTQCNDGSKPYFVEDLGVGMAGVANDHPFHRVFAAAGLPGWNLGERSCPWATGQRLSA